MYHSVPPCTMWEAEPRLYWRVKIGGKWKFVPAVYDLHRGECLHAAGERVTLWWPTEVSESE